MMLNVMAFIVAKTNISRKEEISSFVDNQSSFRNSLTWVYLIISSKYTSNLLKDIWLLQIQRMVSAYTNTSNLRNSISIIYIGLFLFIWFEASNESSIGLNYSHTKESK